VIIVKGLFSTQNSLLDVRDITVLHELFQMGRTWSKFGYDPFTPGITNFFLDCVGAIQTSNVASRSFLS